MGWVQRKTRRIAAEPTNPGNGLFVPRYQRFRNINSPTSRLKNCFYPRVVQSIPTCKHTNRLTICIKNWVLYHPSHCSCALILFIYLEDFYFICILFVYSVHVFCLFSIAGSHQFKFQCVETQWQQRFLILNLLNNKEKIVKILFKKAQTLFLTSNDLVWL